MLINTKLKSDYYHLLSDWALWINNRGVLDYTLICMFLRFIAKFTTFVWFGNKNPKENSTHECLVCANIERKNKERKNLPLSNFHRETSELHRAVRLYVAITMADNKKLVNKYRNEIRLFYSCDTRSNDCQVWMNGIRGNKTGTEKREEESKHFNIRVVHCI